MAVVSAYPAGRGYTRRGCALQWTCDGSLPVPLVTPSDPSCGSHNGPSWYPPLIPLVVVTTDVVTASPPYLYPRRPHPRPPRFVDLSSLLCLPMTGSKLRGWLSFVCELNSTAPSVSNLHCKPFENKVLGCVWTRKPFERCPGYAVFAAKAAVKDSARQITNKHRWNGSRWTCA
jgi:hypothetical protein